MSIRSSVFAIILVSIIISYVPAFIPLSIRPRFGGALQHTTTKVLSSNLFAGRGRRSLVELTAKKKKKDTTTLSDNDDETINNNNNNNNNNDNNDTWESINSELIEESIRGMDGINPDDNEDDWVPDTVKAQRRRKQRKIPAEKEEKVVVVPVPESKKSTIIDPMERANSKKSPYTDDEEELIQAMGGRTKKASSTSRRQEGYLGDCTIQEIAMDYSVPVSYIADVLCMWGVPIPINVQDRLGDLVTGEQAFAIVEAVNTLDVATLHDRYSNTNLLQLCYEWDIDIQDAFSFCIQEGYNLPFGVQTCLRVEQEEELLRVVGAKNNYSSRDYEYSDDDY